VNPFRTASVHRAEWAADDRIAVRCVARAARDEARSGRAAAVFAANRLDGRGLLGARRASAVLSPRRDGARTRHSRW
jgi:hypothetical protein